MRDEDWGDFWEEERLAATRKGALVPGRSWKVRSAMRMEWQTRAGSFEVAHSENRDHSSGEAKERPNLTLHPTGGWKAHSVRTCMMNSMYGHICAQYGQSYW